MTETKIEPVKKGVISELLRQIVRHPHDVAPWQVFGGNQKPAPKSNVYAIETLGIFAVCNREIGPIAAELLLMLCGDEQKNGWKILAHEAPGIRVAAKDALHKYNEFIARSNRMQRSVAELPQKPLHTQNARQLRDMRVIR